MEATAYNLSPHVRVSSWGQYNNPRAEDKMLVGSQVMRILRCTVCSGRFPELRKYGESER